MTKKEALKGEMSMGFRRSPFNFVVLLTLIFILFSIQVPGLASSVKKLTITIRKPGEIDIKSFKKLAIGVITDEGGQDSQNAKIVGDALAQSLQNSKYFQVYDRQYMNTVLAEHNYQFNDLFDVNTVKEMGKYIGASALICGRIQVNSYRENLEQYKFGGASEKLYFKKGKYNVAVNFTVIDVLTGKILAIRNIQSTSNKETKAFANTPIELDKFGMYYECVQDITQRFARYVTPQTNKVEIEFETDNSVPETEQAIVFLNLQEQDEAIGILEQVIAKPGFERLNRDVQASVYYDLGLIQTYAGYFDDACGNLKKAILINSKSKRYLAVYEKAKDEKVMADQLKAQEETVN